MPIYEYECKRCSLRFELKRRFGEDDGACCPRCQGEVQRLFSPVAIIFKGPGFYVTDSKNNHGHPSDTGKSDKVEADQKSESD